MEEEDQNQGQDRDQNQDQDGEELLKLLQGEEEVGDEQEKKEEPTPSSDSLLSLTEISRLTGIMYVTLKRYAVLHDSTDLAGLWEGEGRGKKYHPEAVEVFKRLKAESRKGRPRGPQPDIAPLASKPTTTPGRGGVADPLPPSSPKKGKKKGGKKGAPKRPGKPSLRAESTPVSAGTSLSTQEADRAMLAIERVQLMARYEAVKEMVGQWVREMERLEKVLGLGGEGVL